MSNLEQMAVNTKHQTLSLVADDAMNSKANASLIAAAPDLLAALQEILPHIVARPIVGAAILERARAAIARATN